MPTRIEKLLLGLLLAILAGIVVHAPFSVFFGSMVPQFELVIKAWKEILLSVSLIVAAVVVKRRKLWKMLLNDWLIRLSAMYALLHIIIAFVLPTSAAQMIAGLMVDLRYVAYFVLVYVLLKIVPAWRSLFIKTAIFGAAIVIGFGVLQLFLPPDILRHIGYDKNTTIAPYLTVDQNEDYVRINSTLRGPNPLGAYTVIVLAGLAAALAHGKLMVASKKQWLKVAAAVAATTTVLWVSYSRSALGAAVLALGLIGVLSLPRAWLKKYGAFVLIAVLIACGGLVLARSTDFVSHVILHEDPNEGNDVNSNDGHIESLIDGSERLVRQPLGAGVGSTGSASLLGNEPLIIENQYLFVAHEVGWLGLGLFIALFGLILHGLWRRRSDWLALAMLASGVGLAAIGLLQPVWVDDTIGIMWWGLAAVALAESRTKRREL